MEQTKVGDVVKDWRRDQVAEVVAVNGDTLTVARPSGIEWPAEARQCRPATEQEKADLDYARRTLVEARKQERRHLA